MADKGKNIASRTKDAPTNPRGIPYAPFVDKVEDYVTSRADVEPTLRNFQEMIAKYQWMESNMQRKSAGLQDKIPDIQKTLDSVRFLKTRTVTIPARLQLRFGIVREENQRLTGYQDETDPIETTFELNDTLYAKAEVPPTEEVYIWLGANVMLAYPMDEAEALLAERLSKAKKSLEDCDEDLEFLREQITTMEVATARVYNWDVVQKRKDKGEEDGKDTEVAKSGG
ncbi:hypothetical protein VM1G_07693 [Cytospora mali]|uniref:Prefoldin subunit 3 n=1 Tax=Cytospora mali TaxID=578113 RepID=A0A194W7J3_CYTMA|nr:hypothetical protein VM1G_07693 [Valsa mali]